MGKKSARYCVRVRDGMWQIWDRKLEKWWGTPYKQFPPRQVIDNLNKKNKTDICHECGGLEGFHFHYCSHE